MTFFYGTKWIEECEPDDVRKLSNADLEALRRFIKNTQDAFSPEWFTEAQTYQLTGILNCVEEVANERAMRFGKRGALLPRAVWG